MKPTGFIKYEHDCLKIGEKNFSGKEFSKKQRERLIDLNAKFGDRYFSIIHRGIKFKSYVGVIQLGDLTIEILPKIDRENTETNWQDVLIEMLKKAGRLKTKRLDDAHVKKGKVNLIQLYFQFYIAELDKLIHKGLIKQYRQETKNVNALKGKLEFAGNIQRNLIHKERFYTTHQVYDQDHGLHQVLRYALSIVEQFSKGTFIYSDCKATDLHFHNVKLRPISKGDLDKIKFNRKNNDYHKAFDLARLIILNYSPDLASGKEKMFALLFDMNKLWEHYILAEVKRACYKRNGESNLSEEQKISIDSQKYKPFWGSSNRLAPDIILKKGSECFIIDTKWKIIDTSDSEQNMRQIYTYCRFWNAKKGMLLYPGLDNSAEFTNFNNDEFESGCSQPYKHQCKLGSVSVLNREGKLKDTIGEQILKLMGLT